jgi:hypothetical protein
VKQNLTNDYGLLRGKMLKSEALLTLSLEASFEAHSAPTLHGKTRMRPHRALVRCTQTHSEFSSNAWSGTSRDLTVRCTERAG